MVWPSLLQKPGVAVDNMFPLMSRTFTWACCDTLYPEKLIDFAILPERFVNDKNDSVDSLRPEEL